MAVCAGADSMGHQDLARDWSGKCAGAEVAEMDDIGNVLPLAVHRAYVIDERHPLRRSVGPHTFCSLDFTAQ